MRRRIVGLVLGAILLLPIFTINVAYGVPSSIKQMVTAKWASTNFTVCIFNQSDPKYEKLFEKAIEEWRSTWPHFSYQLQKNLDCIIDVSIRKSSIPMQEAGHAGETYVQYYDDGDIISADITMPTAIEAEVLQGYYCCRSVFFDFPEQMFYVTALHEFGHALNLDHAVDNELEPLDVMNPVVHEDRHYMISAVTIKTLDEIYGTSTVAKNHEINMKPSVTVDATLDKEDYLFDDTLKLSGKVSKAGGAGTVLLFDPLVNLFAFTSFQPRYDGTFDLEVDLFTFLDGRWVLAVQYMGASKYMAFDVKELKYRVMGQTERPVYSVGEVVKITGNVTRIGEKVLVNIINPEGIMFSSMTVPIDSDRSFNTQFTLKESGFTIPGTWTVTFEYADVEIESEGASETQFTLQTGKSPPLANPAVELPLKKSNVELRVLAKQIRDLTLIRVKSMPETNEDIHGLSLSFNEGTLKASKGPKGWEKKVDGNTVNFFTSTSPLEAGQTLYFILKTDGLKMIDWQALSDDGKTLTDGSITRLL